MDKNKKEQIILYVFVTFAALALGLGAREYVLSTGADNFVGAIAFVSVAAVAVALYILFKMVLKEFFDWLLKGRITKKVENSDEIPKEEEKPEVLSSTGTSQVEEIDESAINSEIKTEQTYIEIDPDEIFKSRMFGKFEILEKRLIADKYLSADLRWIDKHKNGRRSKQRLVCFIIGLVDSNYFMSGRDSMIRSYFEARYKISLEQVFEPARRARYITEYKITFFNYPF